MDASIFIAHNAIENNFLREPHSLEAYSELREELEERQASFREFIEAYDAMDAVTDLTRDGLHLLPASPQREFFKMALGRDFIETSDTVLRPMEGYLGITREQTYLYASLPMLCLSTYNAGQSLKTFVIGKSSLKGVHHSNTKRALDYGNKKHKEFKETNEIRHIREPLKDSNKRILWPDLHTEQMVHELKPGTITGVKKGLQQLQRYQDASDKKGLLHLYAPQGKSIDLEAIVEKNFSNNPIVQKPEDTFLKRPSQRVLL